MPWRGWWWHWLALATWPVHGATAAAPNAGAQAWYRGVVNDLRPLQSTLLGALNAASWLGGRVGVGGGGPPRIREGLTSA